MFFLPTLPIQSFLLLVAVYYNFFVGWGSVSGIIWENLKINNNVCQESGVSAFELSLGVGDKCVDPRRDQTSVIIQGTSLLIEEAMGAVGHSISILALLENIHKFRINSIFYTARGTCPWSEMLITNILEISKQSPQSSVFVGDGTTTEHPNVRQTFNVTYQNICFERLLRRRKTVCTSCLSHEKASEYRRYVYAKVGVITDDDALLTASAATGAKVITFVTRGNRYRSIGNTADFISYMQSRLPNLTDVPFRIDIFDSTLSHSYESQVKVSARSDVLITPHGAFLSNIIHMRNTSLVVEIAKAEPKLNYKTTPLDKIYYQPWQMFQNLADDFNVSYYRLHAREFMFEWQGGVFSLNAEEIVEATVTVAHFLSVKGDSRYKMAQRAYLGQLALKCKNWDN